MATVNRKAIPWSPALELRERKEREVRLEAARKKKAEQDAKLAKLYPQLHHVESQIRKCKADLEGEQLLKRLVSLKEDIEFHIRRVKAGVE